MKGPQQEKWQMLCEQAANEQDPEKLIKLVKQINELLEKKHRHFNDQKIAE